jgi:hypothetical protein
MKHRFLDLTKLALCNVQKADYEFPRPFAYLKHHLTRLHPIRIFWRSEGGKYVSELSGLLKHRFIDHQSIIFNIEKSENEFSGLYDQLKLCFIDFTKVAFYDVQKADYEFSWQFAYLKITSPTSI